MEAAAAEGPWSDALAQEHLHQQELLAAFRGELGEFARECSAALTSLDSFVDGLGGVVRAIELGERAHQGTRLALDVARRRPQLASTTVEGDPLYDALAGGGDVAGDALERAREALRGNGRTDAELLGAVVESQGVRAVLERLVGPAPLAAVAALQPLLSRVPAPTTVEADDRDSTTLIEALEHAATAVGVEGVAEARALGTALREAAAHAGRAADAVERGQLEDVLARAREQLHADLDALAAVLGPVEASSWRDEREVELEELRGEVRQKLETVERTRRVLLLLLPRLRVAARALALAEKLPDAEDRVDTATPAIARLSLALELGRLRPPAVPRRAAEPTARRRRRLVAALAAAALLVGGAVVAIASLGDDSTTVAATETAGVPAPVVSPVEAVFSQADLATFYSVDARTSEDVEYDWALEPPADDPTCRDFEVLPGRPSEAVWRHADTDGCAHVGTEHSGVVTVVITTPTWTCAALFEGSSTRSGPRPTRCGLR